MVEPTADNPNTGLFIVLGAIGIIAGGAAIYLATQPSKTGITNDPPPGGLSCAKTGQSCVAMGCCLGPMACGSDNTCVGPSSQCGKEYISCAQYPCCDGLGLICEPSTQTCMPIQNGGCTNCSGVCNSGTCYPTNNCLNCLTPNWCDTSGTCVHVCSPDCPQNTYCDSSGCPNPPYEGCGTCTGASSPTNWYIDTSSIQISMITPNPIQWGGPVDTYISFNYSGPGGAVHVGFNACLDSPLGCLCYYTLTDSTNWYVAGASAQQDAYGAFTTQTITFPSGCLACAIQPSTSCAGFGLGNFNVTPFVITPDGQTWTGATVQGLFCC